MGRPLTVTVDARVVFDEVPRGIAKVTVGQYRALAKVRPEWRFRLFHQLGAGPRGTEEFNPFADLPQVSVVPLEMRGDRFALWSRVRLPVANWQTAGPKVFHAPAGPAPWPTFAPLVTTIHDLIPLDSGRSDPAAKAWLARVKRSAYHAARITTPSEYARGRILEHFPMPPERVVVVPWAADPPPVLPPTRERLDALRAGFGVPPGVPYALHLGMGDPRKNTAWLIREWAAVPEAVRGNVTLLIVGVAGPARAEFAGLAAELGVASGVRVCGYAPDADLRDLLAGSLFLAYPTRDEGFGLPVLDAFAAGVPVLAGDRTSVPEVAGDASETVDPTEPGAVAAGLRRLLSDPARRAWLVERGRERLKLYSWETTAERVATVFEEAARAPRARPRRAAGAR